MSADAECPWPGLIPYEENDHRFFTGRDTEIAAMIAIIHRAPLAVLFGQSGLGKTSLIQAGLFPRLREDGGFPVWIRLSFDPHAPPLTEQVLKKITEAAENTKHLYPDRPELHVTPPAFDGQTASPRTLWEYFHRRDGYFWGARNRLITPIIVLDQFEEWFTKGANLPSDQRHTFLNEIHQLLDNDPPANLHSTEGWNLERVPLSVVISLREDYLAHLSELREFFPGLRESNLRLVPFSEAQAREVIEKPAPWPADYAFTAAALDSLRQAAREPGVTAVPLGAGTDYDPAILSLLLSRLFGSLQQTPTGEARANVVRQKGQDVLLDFYRETLADAGANNRERGFLEEKLVTHSGLRNSVALDDAEKRYHARRPVLNRLREARLLHFDDRALGHQRVELAHDVLCGVVLRARDQRRGALLRRRRAAAAVAVGVILIWAAIAFFRGWKDKKARESLEAVFKQVEIVDRKISDGQLDEARRALKLASQPAAESSTLDSADQRYQLRALSRSAHSLGVRFKRDGATRKALDAFTESLNADKKIAQLYPNDNHAQADVAQELSWVGDQHSTLGDPARAIDAFRTSNEIFRKLATKDPDNTEWQSNLALSYNRLGDMLEAQGDLTGAFQAFRINNDIFQKLATEDPGNTDWQRNLAVSHNRLGGVLEAQGNLTGAFQAFRINNDMLQKLATKDPGNTTWQRNLAVSHGRLGAVLEAQGDFTGAFQAVRIYNDICQKLATKDPDDTDWQRNLAVSHSRLGSVLEARGDLTGAVQAFRVDSAIFQKLVTKDPDNTDWQRNLAVSHRRIGDAQTKLNQLSTALGNYRTAVEHMMPLVNRVGGLVLWRWDIARIRVGLGHALRLSGEPDAALPELQEAERDMRFAADASPEDVVFQGGHALVALRIGQTLLALNPPQTEQGLAKLKDGRDRLIGLKQNPGLNFFQKQWLAELEHEIAKTSPAPGAP